MTTIAEVRLWGRRIAAVSIEAAGGPAVFEYDGSFRRSGIEIAPLVMPLRGRVHSFPELPRETFHGLPGLLADSLPDAFGGAVIDAWLASQGRLPHEINAVERLCYTGTRGMGALEFRPVLGPDPSRGSRLHVDALVDLASEVLQNRDKLDVSFASEEREQALREILRVGASAGGARAKAIIAWNPSTNEVRSGQVEVGDGYEHWLLKLDGVTGNRDRELADPEGYGAIEYAYALMAAAAGITMRPCRLFEENGRRHFMTRRFDRGERGEKYHMQSLGAIAHLDFNLPGGHAYEQALQVIRRLELTMNAVEEQFRRMAFNIVARNQDDHVKNIAFLMDKTGAWSLSPAFDVIYSYNPDGAWTSQHQMSMNGKRDRFELEDFKRCGQSASMKRGRAESIVDEVRGAVARWPSFAEAAGVRPEQILRIARTHRLDS